MVSKRRKSSGAMMTDDDSEADTETPERSRVTRRIGITIYQICCEPLQLVYIGQTKRSLQVRITEHKKKPPQI